MIRKEIIVDNFKTEVQTKISRPPSLWNRIPVCLFTCLFILLLIFASRLLIKMLCPLIKPNQVMPLSFPLQFPFEQHHSKNFIGFLNQRGKRNGMETFEKFVISKFTAHNQWHSFSVCFFFALCEKFISSGVSTVYSARQIYMYTIHVYSFYSIYFVHHTPFQIM